MCNHEGKAPRDKPRETDAKLELHCLDSTYGASCNFEQTGEPLCKHRMNISEGTIALESA